jgi:hypothetical protein
VAGVLAHEEAHVYQIRSAINNQLENQGGFHIKHLELHADYMAGAYFAWREKLRPESPGSLLKTFFAELPGTPSDYSSYHGSPKDRLEAYNQGLADFPRLKLGSGPPAEAAARQGLKYIQVVLRSS